MLMALQFAVLGISVVSFGIWWWVYLKEAKNPDGHPPSMWLITVIHMVMTMLGFVLPFFFTWGSGAPIGFLDKMPTNNLIDSIAVGFALLVLGIAFLIGVLKSFAR